MNAETLQALEGSIRKWDCICQGIGVDDGPNNYPLCQLFYEKGCQGCIIPDCCDNDEYNSWAFSFPKVQNAKLLPKAAHLAEAELIYLLKLLSEGHPWRDMI